jgi:hypothetical protein
MIFELVQENGASFGLPKLTFRKIYDWNNKLNDEEKYFIKTSVAFFASDGIVNEELG